MLKKLKNLFTIFFLICCIFFKTFGFYDLICFLDTDIDIDANSTEFFEKKTLLEKTQGLLLFTGFIFFWIYGAACFQKLLAFYLYQYSYSSMPADGIYYAVILPVEFYNGIPEGFKIHAIRLNSITSDARFFDVAFLTPNNVIKIMSITMDTAQIPELTREHLKTFLEAFIQQEQSRSSL